MAALRKIEQSRLLFPNEKIHRVSLTPVIPMLASYILYYTQKASPENRNVKATEHLGLSCSSNRGPTSWVRVFYRRVFSVTGSEHSTLQTLVDITEMTDGSKMAGIQNIRRQLDGVPDRIAVAKTKCIAARKLL